MQTTSGYFTDRNGDRKSGQLVYVYLGASLATIYEAGTTTAKANPFLSDATGAWSFSAPNDDYKVYKIENGVISEITDTSTTYTTDYASIERIQNGYFYQSSNPWAVTTYFAYDGTFTRTANTGSLKMTRTANVLSYNETNLTATGDASQIIVLPDSASGAPTLSLYAYRSYTLTGTDAVLNSFTASVTIYIQRLDTGGSETSVGSLSITSNDTWTNLSLDLSSYVETNGSYGIRIYGESAIYFTAGSTIANGTSNLWIDDVSLKF